MEQNTCNKCGRPMQYSTESKCNYNDCCMNEYCGCKLGRIKEMEPTCDSTAVIPSITVQSVDGITNLSNCLVHVEDTNTTYYVDDKHRIMITWAGPVDIPGYDMETNPNKYKDQIVTDVEKGVAVIYDKHGNGYMFGITQDSLQTAINNKLDEMAADGTLAQIILTYISNEFVFGFDTVADMKTATNLVAGSYAQTLGFHTLNDGGGALYKISDTGTANEIDIIAVDALYANLISKDEISIKCFGGISTDADDSSILEEAFTYCYNNGCTLLIDEAINFTNPIVVNDVPNIKCTKALNYDGSENTTALLLGTSSKEQNMLNLDVMIKNNTKSTTIVGVKFENINTSKITIRYACQFGVGALFSGNSHGCCYNEIDILNVFYNETGIKLISENSGWCNENKFNGGKFQYRNSENYSNAVGIELAGVNGVRINNNIFFKPAFEFLNIGIKTSYATSNEVYNGRFENVNYVANFDANSRVNIVNVGYGNTGYISAQPTNIVTSAASNSMLTKVKIFDENLYDNSVIEEYNGTNRLVTTNFVIMNSGGSTTDHIASDGNYDLIDGYFIQTVTKKGFGIFIDTSKAKQFYIRKNTALGYAGRFLVKLYDATKTPIATTVIGDIDASSGMLANNDVSNSFRNSVDMDTDLMVIIPEDAKYIFIGGTKVSTDIKIKNLSIYADQEASIATALADL